jgi:hypothetical protein
MVDDVIETVELEENRGRVEVVKLKLSVLFTYEASNKARHLPSATLVVPTFNPSPEADTW